MADQKFPEPPLSYEERQRLYAEDAERELQEDIISGQIAKISARLREARKSGDQTLISELLDEQSRLTDLQLSVR